MIQPIELPTVAEELALRAYIKYGSANLVALDRGVKISTIRSQIKSLRQKFNANTTLHLILLYLEWSGCYEPPTWSVSRN